jgi:subtilisin family serine protease
MAPIRVGIALYFCAALTAGAAMAQDVPADQSVPAFAAEAARPQLLFVEFPSAPLADGTSQAVLDAEYKAFATAAKKAGITYQLRFRYAESFNGVSIQLVRGTADAVTALKGVKAIHDVQIVSRPEADPDLVDLEMASAVTMTGADVVQGRGITGAGITVAVIDSGIDYNHPDFGACAAPGAGCRVKGGRDFAGDLNVNDASPANDLPVPDNDPDDTCNGHGTHVAGIIGADGVVRGVAPSVDLWAVKVFGCGSSTYTDVIMAGIDYAAKIPGLDVVNLSLGAAAQWPRTYPTVQGLDRLVRKGIVAVVAAGNDGTLGLFMNGAPGVGKDMLTVGSVDNSEVSSRYFMLGSQRIGFQPMTYTGAAPAPADVPTSGTSAEIVNVGQGCNADTYLADPAGKIALVARGVCGFLEKYTRAAAAGAVGVIVSNNTLGVLSGTLGTGPLGASRPWAVGVQFNDGALLRAATAPVTVTYAAGTARVPNELGGFMSGFSSLGPSPDLEFKPDVSAPGGAILSTYPLTLGSGYAVLSGTSMATPHVVGAVAQILQARPGLTPQAVKDMLTNSAVPRVSSAFGPNLEAIIKQGGGLIDIDASLDAKSVVTPSRLSLGERQPGAPFIQTLTLRNLTPDPIEYTITHEPTLSLKGVLASMPNGLGQINTFGGAGLFAASAASVIVPGNGTATVDVGIDVAAALANASLYGGYIRFDGGGQTLRVPYMGFKGDYQGFAVLSPGVNTANQSFGMPWLAFLNAGSYSRINPAAAPPANTRTFSMAGTDFPYLVYQLGHQVTRLQVNVRDANGVLLGRAFSVANLRRSINQIVGQPSSFFADRWDGTVQSGKAFKTLPNGQYKLEISILRPLGDSAVGSHYETFTTQTFTVQRQ